ncbi:NUDIX domain-containing protein [Candidatus Pacearchaeota archaeon]|nr:NUDIX domain-containing protein [Candidatus Pacearchaeota archaeon]
MSELLQAYDRDGKLVKVQERKSLLKEIEDYSRIHGDANLAVPAIYLILTNSQGKLYVVQRGDKPENPNRYDKTVGGHVTKGETHVSTLYRETKEEIGSEVILTDLINFHDAIKQNDTKKYAIIRTIDFNPWMKSIRAVKNDTPWVKRHRVMIFAGIYDGDLNFVDGEATGFQLLPKHKLIQKMREDPSKFTDDLDSLLRNYSIFF